MDNLPTTHRTNQPPAVATVTEREVIRRYSNAVEWSANPLARSSMSSSDAPSTEHRQVMGARRRMLADALVPASSAAIGTMIASLRSVMPSHDNTDPVQVVALYRSALSRFPEWAVAHVCRAFLEGRAGGSTTFAPTPADIASRCDALVQPHRDEQLLIGRILDAEIIPEPESDEKRAEVAARVKQWVKDREPANETNRKLSEDEFDAFAAKFRDTLKSDPPKLSSLAKHAAGLIPHMQERRQRDDMDERVVAPGRPYDEERAAWDQQEQEAQS